MAGIEINIVSLILVSALILLVSGKIAVDKISLGILSILALTGILTPRESIAGFANPAVITVGAMFLLSKGLIRTGAVGIVTELVLTLSKSKRHLAFALVLLSVGLASAFINNTPVVVLFIPIVMGLSCECNFSPSTLLIPMSYVSILGGTCTLIGTSTNLIVSDLAASHGYGPLSMFEFGAAGIPIAAAGLIFILIFSTRTMPGRVDPVCELNQASEKRYIAELIVPPKSPLLGQTDIIGYGESQLGLDIIEVFRNGSILDPARIALTIQPQDILMVKGSADNLVSAMNKKILVPAHGEEDLHLGSGMQDDLIVELIVPPMSTMLKEPLLSTELKDDAKIQIIAIRSRHTHYSYRKIQRVRLRIGDIILVRCPRHKLETIRKSQDFIIIEDIHHALIDKEKAGIASLIFAGVVGAATLGLTDIMTAAITGVFLMTLTRCLSLKDAYRALEPDVLLLIIATIALGAAMETTGATALYAGLFLDLFSGMGPGAVLTGIIVLASICTHILSNNATAVLLLPIAVSTALSLGVSPKPFILGICFGASACFATPIGYQTNLLVYGPGRYRFSDFLKLGIPLNILVITMAALIIPRVWPF